MLSIGVSAFGETSPRYSRVLLFISEYCVLPADFLAELTPSAFIGDSFSFREGIDSPNVGKEDELVGVVAVPVTAAKAESLASSLLLLISSNRLRKSGLESGFLLGDVVVISTLLLVGVVTVAA